MKFLKKLFFKLGLFLLLPLQLLIFSEFFTRLAAHESSISGTNGIQVVILHCDRLKALCLLKIYVAQLCLYFLDTPLAQMYAQFP